MLWQGKEFGRTEGIPLAAAGLQNGGKPQEPPSHPPASRSTLRPRNTPAARVRQETGMATPQVGVVMGSSSDWEVMRHAADRLAEFGIRYETRVVSAHRTPDLLFEYAQAAAGRGLGCIIAGAGGAAHLPGMLAAKTTVPILGVPVPSRHLQGLDSLLSIVQMPAGVPVATFAVGDAGAHNAGLFAVAMLAAQDPALRDKLDRFRAAQDAQVRATSLPASSP